MTILYSNHERASSQISDDAMEHGTANIKFLGIIYFLPLIFGVTFTPKAVSRQATGIIWTLTGQFGTSCPGLFHAEGKRSG